MIYVSSCLSSVCHFASDHFRTFQSMTNQAFHNTVQKVHSFFKEHGHILMTIAACSISAYLSPQLFFSGLAVGMFGTLLLDYLNGSSQSIASFLLDRGHDVFLVHATLTTVSAISKIVEAANSQFFASMSRDGLVSCLLSGILAGSTIIALSRKI